MAKVLEIHEIRNMLLNAVKLIFDKNPNKFEEIRTISDVDIKVKISENCSQWINKGIQDGSERYSRLRNKELIDQYIKEQLEKDLEDWEEKKKERSRGNNSKDDAR